MSRTRVVPYKPASGSARALSRALGVLRLRRPTSFRPRLRDLIINWGCSEDTWPDLVPCGILNYPRYVSAATNKVAAFQTFAEHGVPTVEFTEDREVANEWKDAGGTVVCRTMLRASGGRGITLCSGDEPLPDAPLYTLYAKKRDEYRVHIAGGEVIHVQHKRKRRDFEGDTDTQIRNFDNGWVFCIGDAYPPQVVLDAAVLAVQSLRLHFGAVDVGYNHHYERAYVYEVNTAPNLEGTTLSKYAEYFGEAMS